MVISGADSVPELLLKWVGDPSFNVTISLSIIHSSIAAPRSFPSLGFFFTA